MKAATTYKMANRVRKPERSMAKVIEGHVIDKRHKFTTPSCDVPVAGKADRLEAAAFKQPREKRSMAWQDIVSTTSSPPYYSPKGEVFAQNIADIEFVDQCGPDNNNARCMAWSVCCCVTQVAGRLQAEGKHALVSSAVPLPCL